MISKAERFWISFILRLAFGLLFAFVAIGQFGFGGANDVGYLAFAEQVSKPFAASWLGIFPDIPFGEGSKDITYFFCLAIPFAFAILAVPILTGLFLKPALRLSAIFLVMLGVGQYVIKAPDLSGTVYDFILACLICIGLYVRGQEEKRDEELSV